MKHLLILLSLLLLSSPVIGQSKETGVLFLRIENGELLYYQDGDGGNDGKYVGEIENGKPNGQGTFILHNGKKYIGEFKDGRCNGQGTFIFPDGRKYIGEFKDGKPWNGTTYYKNGNFMRSIVNGEIK